MMDEFTERESFAIQGAIVINELQQMIEKTKKLEMQLIQEASPQVIFNEFYKPFPETQAQQPPRKKMRASE
jgi:hypothetical protein